MKEIINNNYTNKLKVICLEGGVLTIVVKFFPPLHERKRVEVGEDPAYIPKHVLHYTEAKKWRDRAP